MSNQDLNGMKPRIISVLMENSPGALSRVVGLFSQRGYNIDSLNVAPIQDKSLSRLSVNTVCTDQVSEQMSKQLNKLIDVVKVLEVSDAEYLARELMLVKVRARGAERAEVTRCVDIFRARVIDVGVSYYTIAIEGNPQKLNSFMSALGDVTVLEVMRSGVCGMARSEKALAL